MGISNLQMHVISCLTDHRIGTAFPITDGSEYRQMLRFNGKDVTLLSLVAPNLKGAHAGLVTGNTAQFNTPPASPVLHQFR